MAGARLAGAETGPLSDYARCLGLAFQIADDILDVEGDAATLGKATGKDAEAGKATLVGLWGTDRTRNELGRLVVEAETLLAPYGSRAAILSALARFIVNRTN